MRSLASFALNEPSKRNGVLSQPTQSFPLILLESREANIIPPSRHDLPGNKLVGRFDFPFAARIQPSATPAGVAASEASRYLERVQNYTFA